MRTVVLGFMLTAGLAGCRGRDLHLTVRNETSDPVVIRVARPLDRPMDPDASATDEIVPPGREVSVLAGRDLDRPAHRSWAMATIMSTHEDRAESWSAGVSADVVQRQRVVVRGGPGAIELIVTGEDGEALPSPRVRTGPWRDERPVQFLR